MVLTKLLPCEPLWLEPEVRCGKKVDDYSAGTPEEKTKISPAALHTGKHILLVEDEKAISDVQYRVLIQEPFSHKVDVAYTGQAALDLLAGNDYDFISLDYILPGKMNGMDVYRRIRETHKTIPILFVSGNIEFLESIKELKQKDARIDHLSKPCQNTDYINAKRLAELLPHAFHVVF